ncbi:MAG: 6-phosphogluconolactonase [Pseudomonadota bacterium]
MSDQGLREFVDRAAASRAAAELLADALRARLAVDARATLIVSGGSTPVACLNHLADQALPWSRVDVSLTDERCVAEDHEASNSGMVRRELLRGAAAAATVVAPDAAALATPRFAAVLVGMGADGHFASLFPDAADLATGLDLSNAAGTLRIETSASPHTRISMTLARLVAADTLLLLSFGAAKRAVLRAPAGMPIEALLRQSPLVFWAP